MTLEIKQEVRKWKFEHQRFHDRWETPSAEEYHVIQTKAQGQLLSGFCNEIILTAFTKVKD